MSGFLEKLAARITGRREKAVAGFDGLTRAVADDKPPSAEQAELILADAGKSAQDLAAAVDRLRARRQARATLDKALAAPAELRRVAAALEAADAARNQAFELAQGEHAAAVAPLLERHRALERLVEDGRRAEMKLRDTAHEPAGLAELREQLAQAKELRDRHLQQAGKAQVAAAQAMTGAQASYYSDGYRAGHRQEAERQLVGYDQALKAAEPHAEEVRRLEREIEKVENLALVP